MPRFVDRDAALLQSVVDDDGNAAIRFARQAPGIAQRLRVAVVGRRAVEDHGFAEEGAVVGARVGYRRGVSGVDRYALKSQYVGTPALPRSWTLRGARYEFIPLVQSIPSAPKA
jgi:hypothetical protein